MTLEEALARGAGAIDQVLERREREQAIRMFNEGCTGDDIATIRYLQRAADRRWRAKVLRELEADLREWDDIDSMETTV